MGNFGSDSRGGFGRGGSSSNSRFGGRSREFGSRDSGRFERRPLEMHNATCDKCKKQCQVPFRPSGDKPVFCSDCFRNEGSGSNFNSRSSFGSRDRGKPSSSGMSSEQFNQINAKLDKIIKTLEKLEIDTEDEDNDIEVLDEEDDSEVDSGKDLSADSNEDSKDDSDDDPDEDSEGNLRTE